MAYCGVAREWSSSRPNGGVREKTDRSADVAVAQRSVSRPRLLLQIVDSKDAASLGVGAIDGVGEAGLDGALVVVLEFVFQAGVVAIELRLDAAEVAAEYLLRLLLGRALRGCHTLQTSTFLDDETIRSIPYQTSSEC